MNRMQFGLAFLIGCLILCSVQPADAQHRYSPSRDRPTLSPYFDLFRRDPGPLGSYHSYVRPRLELQRSLAQQAAHIQRQQASVRTLQQQVSQIERGGPVRPTGTGSVFTNYSHYYSGLRSGGSSGSRSTRSSGLRSGRSSGVRSGGYSGSSSGGYF